MTLDQAKECWELYPCVDAGTAWINAAIKYASDEMISWDEVSIIWDEVFAKLSYR